MWLLLLCTSVVCSSSAATATLMPEAQCRAAINRAALWGMPNGVCISPDGNVRLGIKNKINPNFTREIEDK